MSRLTLSGGGRPRAMKYCGASAAYRNGACGAPRSQRFPRIVGSPKHLGRTRLSMQEDDPPMTSGQQLAFSLSSEGIAENRKDFRNVHVSRRALAVGSPDLELRWFIG